MALVWEEVKSRQKTGTDVHPARMSRARVPGGWLVYTWEPSNGNCCLTFYPDPEHQ